jgi:hypothetical protein
MSERQPRVGVFYSGTTPRSGDLVRLSPHHRVVRLEMAVPAQISVQLLGAGEGRRGGLPICIIKEMVIGLFSRQDSVMLYACPH